MQLCSIFTRERNGNDVTERNGSRKETNTLVDKRKGLTKIYLNIRYAETSYEKVAHKRHHTYRVICSAIHITNYLRQTE